MVTIGKFIHWLIKKVSFSRFFYFCLIDIAIVVLLLWEKKIYIYKLYHNLDIKQLTNSNNALSSSLLFGHVN